MDSAQNQGTITFRLKIVVTLVFGIISGLPFATTAGNLSLMLKESGVNLQTIGFFTLIGLPYSFKYLVAPIFDLHKPFLHKLIGKRFGKMRSWLLLAQPLLCGALVLSSYVKYTISPHMFVLSVCMITVFSAIQDILIDAFRIELYEIPDQGFAGTAAIIGYQTGMLLGSIGGLILAHNFSWPFAYRAIGILILCFGVFSNIVSTMIFPSDYVHHQTGLETSYGKEALIPKILDYFKTPFTTLLQHKGLPLLLCIITLYKLSDGYLGVMIYPFLNDMNFSKLDIAHVMKVYGTAAGFLGMFIGSQILERITIKSALILGCLLQSISNLGYIFVIYAGHNLFVLAIVNSLDSFAGGIGNAAFVVFMVGLCDKKFAATHYALFTSLAVLCRTLISSSSGMTASLLSWPQFFSLSALLCLPALILIIKSKNLSINK